MPFTVVRTGLADIGPRAAPRLRSPAYGAYVAMLTAGRPGPPIVDGMVVAGPAKPRFAAQVGWLDIALTVGLLFFGFGGTGPASHQQHTAAPPPAYLLVALACLPILIGRVRPLWAFVLSGAATMLYIGLGYAYGPILFATGLASFGLALRSPLRRTLVAMAGLLVAIVIVIEIGVLEGLRTPTEILSLGAWFVIPAAIGVAGNARRGAATQIRSEQARRAVTEERLRLAQEVHDVAGHGFSVIAMQAGVALRVLDRDPAAARAALEGIRATSRDALDNLRAEIEALQQGMAGPLRPRLGLADLPALADRLRSSGLPITVEGSAPEDLPVEVDRAAYRIVQESLTNVLRHAGASATAAVRIECRPDLLTIEVSDTGRGGPTPVSAGGKGLDGMRSRAQALGGTVEAGPAAAGGFTVRARLPL
jgi:signal transduction histidine kinase